MKMNEMCEIISEEEIIILFNDMLIENQNVYRKTDLSYGRHVVLGTSWR